MNTEPKGFVQWVNPVRENSFFQEYTWDHALGMWKPNWGPKPSAFVAQPSASMPTPQVRACWRPIKGVFWLHMPVDVQAEAGARAGSQGCPPLAAAVRHWSRARVVGRRLKGNCNEAKLTCHGEQGPTGSGASMLLEMPGPLQHSGAG